jgi:hypothetical protein
VLRAYDSDYLRFKSISALKNIYETGFNQSQPVVNRSWSEPVRTGLVTGKNRKRPVYTGPVRFFGSLGTSRTGLGLGPRLSRPKTETGPDFQTLKPIDFVPLYGDSHGAIFNAQNPVTQKGITAVCKKVGGPRFARL